MLFERIRDRKEGKGKGKGKGRRDQGMREGAKRGVGDFIWECCVFSLSTANDTPSRVGFLSSMSCMIYLRY